jgi:hypothetical protein
MATHLRPALAGCDDASMTLAVYLELCHELAAATARLRDALTAAESDEEVALFASRLRKACEAVERVERAKCAGASGQDLREAACQRGLVPAHDVLPTVLR